MSKTVKRKAWICAVLAVLLLVADQVIKIWIKTTYPIGGGVCLIGEWCQLYFVENEGMAFGMAFGGDVGKLCLSLFRLVATGVIIYLLVKYLRKDSRYTVLLSITLIMVGALGNLIDSTFYGLVFDESTHDRVATLFPEGGGYGRLFHGKVVDMFYFPICEWVWPSWVPWFGGRHAEFFNAIFNLADAAVCVGVALLIVDQLWIAPENKERAEEGGESENKGSGEGGNSENNASEEGRNSEKKATGEGSETAKAEV